MNQVLGGGLITGGEITLSARVEIWSKKNLAPPGLSMAG